METFTESHTWSECREQLIVGYLAPSDTLTVQSPHLRLSTRVRHDLTLCASLGKAPVRLCSQGPQLTYCRVTDSNHLFVIQATGGADSIAQVILSISMCRQKV